MALCLGRETLATSSGNMFSLSKWPSMENSFYLVAAAITLLFVTAHGRVDESMMAPSPEFNVLCISECGTCPMICAPPPPSPPPPPPSSPSSSSSTPTLHRPPPPPPSPKSYSSPPSPSSPHSSSPPAGEQRGGSSSPYYYFYTSGAKQVRFFLNFWELFFLVLASFALFPH
ncbi:formin-like protein 15 [Ananas comosus]|uniref:Formin-like protein 15 n=1 Tax=Ananas comosus TaxID=4615 RepID=A0A6P5GCW0_ANACO|nr:formin-like protein 15 [Ananas comosus]